MRVLWVTNIPPASASRLLGEPPSPFGGWVQGSLEGIARNGRVQVTVASPGEGAVRLLGTDGGADYVSFTPIGRRAAGVRGRDVAAQVIDICRPDLVHLHGTELPHSASFAAVAGGRGIPTVVSVQGLVSFYARHLTAFLPPTVVHGVGTRPWVRSDRVVGMQQAFVAQGRLEQETLRAVGHVIGRTTWDRTCVGQLNPSLRYHHCDETLRPTFYGARWQAEDARPHTIFVSQGHYPVKGLHLLLQALPAVLNRFPDTVVTVAGQSPVAAGRRSPYSRHLLGLLTKLEIADHVLFVGPRDESQMLQHYLSSSLVACPSVIENSPNSVAEAMLLGMPVVAAHVGGVPDMVFNGVNGLTYQADAPYILAHAITTVFDDPAAAGAMGDRARERAFVRHDPERNARRTLDIYTGIIGEGTSR